MKDIADHNLSTICNGVKISLYCDFFQSKLYFVLLQLMGQIQMRIQSDGLLFMDAFHLQGFVRPNIYGYVHPMFSQNSGALL